MEWVLIFAIAWAVKGGWEHVKADYKRSRAARIEHVAGQQPEGILPPHRRAAVARRHAAGYWAGEAAHGFPVTRTGVRTGWIANQADHASQKAARVHAEGRRAAAQTTHAETAASVKKGIAEHKQRQQEAFREMEGVFADPAVTLPGGGRGREAVASVADIAERRRVKAAEGSAGAEGSPPPLPSDMIGAPPGPYAPTRRVDGRPETEADKRFFGLRESGYDGPVTRDGRKPDMSDPQQREDAEALARMRDRAHDEPGPDAASWRPGTGGAPAHESALAPGDRVVNTATGATGTVTSEVSAARPDVPVDTPEGPATWSHDHVTWAGGGLAPGTPSPSTGGSSMSADTTYDGIMTRSTDVATEAEGITAAASTRREQMSQIADDMQGSEVGSKTVGLAMDALDAWTAVESAMKTAGEAEEAFAGGVRDHHAELNEAHQNASDGAAKPEFYEA
jgi:hypothetical protein